MCLSIWRSPYPCVFLLRFLFEESVHYLQVVCSTELYSCSTELVCSTELYSSPLSFMSLHPSEFPNGASPSIAFSADLCIEISSKDDMSCLLVLLKHQFLHSQLVTLMHRFG